MNNSEKKIKKRNIKRDEQRIDHKLKQLDRKLKRVDREKREISKISQKLEKIINNMEKSNLHEYIELMNNKGKLIKLNFLIGISRGLGTAIGFTILAAVVIYMFQKLIALNIPVLGDFIAEIVEIVQNNLSRR